MGLSVNTCSTVDLCLYLSARRDTAKPSAPDGLHLVSVH